MKILSSLLRNNKVKVDGGVIKLEPLSSMVLRNTEFNENFAITGAVLYPVWSTVEIFNCSFTNNIAIQDGSIIRLWNSNAVIFKSTFINNTAGDLGNVVRCDSLDANNNVLHFLDNNVGIDKIHTGNDTKWQKCHIYENTHPEDRAFI